MVRAACMFGNSMTLPLVFMGSLLGGGPGERAVGYLALYQLAWSPMLWALGPRVLRPGVPGAAGEACKRDRPRRLWLGLVIIGAVQQRVPNSCLHVQLRRQAGS